MNKTRYIFLLATIILVIFALSACGFDEVKTIQGSGNVVEETREVSSINGVNLATIGDLTIEVGDTETLRVEAEDNLMAYLETEVRGGELRIETQNRIRLDPTKPINYYLTVKDLDTIEISSVGNIEAPDLEAEDFTITIGSTGDLEMGELKADSLEVDIGSTGKVEIAGGEVKSQNIIVSGTGSYAAQDMASDKVDVRLRSTGSATIWVRDQLKANLSSTGDLHYRGDPTVDTTTSSTGEVIQFSE